jgi:superfamily II DNA or RNA helicase
MVDLADEFSENEADEFITKLKLPHEVRDYQKKAFIYAIRNRRGLLVSPTASGKSLIIYLITRYLKGKTLIIVPTISLVSQMFKDFKDYGLDSETYMHKITAGADKESNKPIIVSTWQSIYKMPKELMLGARPLLKKPPYTWWPPKQFTNLVVGQFDIYPGQFSSSDL